MKKAVILFSLTLVTMVAFAVVPPPGGGSCSVSSDEKKNTGFCRTNDNGKGGDVCYSSGTGTACSGNLES